MKVGTVAYLPAACCGVNSFVKNATRYRTEHPLIFYSDAPEAYPGMDVATIPDVPKTVLYRNLPMSANNSAYIRGVEMALKHELDYVLYLETDVRVRGDGWDGKLFDEFFKHKNAIVGGTPSVWNWGFCPAATAIKIIRFVNRVVKKTGRPPLLWQSVGRDGQAPPHVFPNGAGSIAHTTTVDAIFGGRKYDWGTFAANTGAWDVLIGRALYNQFGMEIFDRFSILPSMYSGFKDCHFSLVERKKMLMDGDVVLVHQIKDDFVPDP